MTTSRPVTVLLIDDQAIVAESVRRMLASEPDIQFHYCQEPAKAIETTIRRQQFGVTRKVMNEREWIERRPCRGRPRH